jgi:hypothetical protein
MLYGKALTIEKHGKQHIPHVMLQGAANAFLYNRSTIPQAQPKFNKVTTITMAYEIKSINESNKRASHVAMHAWLLFCSALASLPSPASGQNSKRIPTGEKI